MPPADRDPGALVACPCSGIAALRDREHGMSGLLDVARLSSEPLNFSFFSAPTRGHIAGVNCARDLLRVCMLCLLWGGDVQTDRLQDLHCLQACCPHGARQTCSQADLRNRED